MKQQKNSSRNSCASSLNFILLSITTFIFFISCAALKQPVFVEKPTDQAASILDTVRIKWEKVTALRGFFRISGKIGNKQGSLKAAIILYLPDKIRMEFITPGGTTEAVLTSDGKTVSLYYPAEKVFFFGNADKENMNKIMGIDLTPEEVLRAMIGSGCNLSDSPVGMREDSRILEVKYNSSSPDYYYLLSIDSEERYIKSTTLYKKDAQSLFAEVLYSNFIHGETYSYPRKINIDFPTKNRSYQIRILNAGYLTRELDTAPFHQEYPMDAKIYRLENIQVKGTILFGEE